MSAIEEIKRWDSKVTFAIGYRNLFNIVVIALGFVILMTTTISNAIGVAEGTILLVLGGKWALSQLRENIDAMNVEEL